MQVFLTGGFADPGGDNPAANARIIYEYMPNARFRKVGEESDLYGGGISAVTIPNKK